MAIVWYRSTSNPTGGTSGYRSIKSKDVNALITMPYTYNDILYGTQQNPVYAVYVGWSLLPGTWYEYYVSNNNNIAGEYESQFQYTTVVGVIDGDINPPSVSNYSTGDYGINVKINGKWRAKDNWISTQYWAGPYFIPLIHTVTLKDGTSYAGDKTGNSSTNYSSTYIYLGDRQFGSSSTSYELSETYRDMVVDFGELPQDVPQLYYDFITTNFNPIYPNTYTVNTPDGVNLASIIEQPPIISTTLENAGDSYRLFLRMSNDTVQTLTWSYPLPEGKVFSGLGIKQGSYDIVIPVGERSVEIKNSTNFYLIFDNYTPPPVFPDPPPLPEKPPKPVRQLTEYFDIALYQCTAEYNRVDKTNYLTQVGTLNGVMRDASSITDLTITIESLELPNFNYVYITKFNRYYFVNDIRIVRNFVYEIDMTVDVLMSYKDAIKSLRAFVDRNENTQNPLLIDKKKVIEQGVDIEVTEIPNELFINPSDTDDDSQIYIVLNGYKIDSADNV